MAHGAVLQTVSTLVTLLSHQQVKLGVLRTSHLTLSHRRQGSAASRVSFQLDAITRQKGGGMGKSGLESSLDIPRDVSLWLPGRRRGKSCRSLFFVLLRFHIPVLLTSRSLLLWPNFPASVCALSISPRHVVLAPFPPAA